MRGRYDARIFAVVGFCAFHGRRGGSQPCLVDRADIPHFNFSSGILCDGPGGVGHRQCRSDPGAEQRGRARHGCRCVGNDASLRFLEVAGGHYSRHAKRPERGIKRDRCYNVVDAGHGQL